jgi:hypothetical protein
MATTDAGHLAGGFSIVVGSLMFGGASINCR